MNLFFIKVSDLVLSYLLIALLMMLRIKVFLKLSQVQYQSQTFHLDHQNFEPDHQIDSYRTDHPNRRIIWPNHSVDQYQAYDLDLPDLQTV